jgi:hypothetical protein
MTSSEGLADVTIDAFYGVTEQTDEGFGKNSQLRVHYLALCVQIRCITATSTCSTNL